MHAMTDKIVNLPDALDRSRDSLSYRLGKDIALYSFLALSILGLWKLVELAGGLL